MAALQCREAFDVVAMYDTSVAIAMVSTGDYFKR